MRAPVIYSPLSFAGAGAGREGATDDGAVPAPTPVLDRRGVSIAFSLPAADAAAAPLAWLAACVASARAPPLLGCRVFAAGLCASAGDFPSPRQQPVPARTPERAVLASDFSFCSGSLSAPIAACSVVARWPARIAAPAAVGCSQVRAAAIDARQGASPLPAPSLGRRLGLSRPRLSQLYYVLTI